MEATKEKLQIYAIEIPQGYYITKNLGTSNYSFNHDALVKYLYNGQSPQLTWLEGWYFIKDIPTKVSHMQSQPNINYRFILKDDSLVSDKIPLVLDRLIACDKAECGEYVWKPEYENYKSLYELVSDEQPNIEIEDEFDFKIVMSVDTFQPPDRWDFKTSKKWDSYKRDWTIESVTPHDVKHQIIDQIVFPDILLHTRPSKLSAKDSYEIIRAYIKDNIDPKVSQVEYDNDSFFIVKKRIPLSKPYETKIEKKTGRKRKEIVHKMVTDKNITVFSMAHELNYKTYGVIEGFEGIDESDLKKKIEEYLQDVITVINEPIKECPNCNGTGVIEIKKVE